MKSRPVPNAVMTIKGREDIKIAVHVPAFDRAKAALDECDLTTWARRCGKTRLTTLQFRFLQELAKEHPETPNQPSHGPRGRWGALK